ncbi:MAG TPA: hypothetical protein VHQ20_02005, partial [Patescibacteria group bacterium]|nr:hypothetical protein [Patescibacteria group bacterium]
YIERGFLFVLTSAEFSVYFRGLEIFEGGYILTTPNLEQKEHDKIILPKSNIKTDGGSSNKHDCEFDHNILEGDQFSSPFSPNVMHDPMSQY